MKLPIISLLSSVLIICTISPARANGGNDTPPNASFGIAGSFGEYSAWERKKGETHMRYGFAPAYGGGLVFEKMFNNLIGIHSGLWFNRFSIDMQMKESWKWTSVDPMSFVPMKMLVTGWSVSVPLSLLISLNASFFSFNILAGIKYTHIVDTDIKLKSFMLTYRRHFDLLPYINQPQFGFTLGITFKFRVARFIDLFVGGIGGLSVTEFIREGDDVSLLFDLTTTAGVMFRTNLFPIPADVSAQ